MPSACRAALAMTVRPVAATTTGTFGTRARSSHSSRLGKPSRSTVSPRRYACTAARWRSNDATGSSCRPIRCTAESPRPRPRTARPPLSTWSASAADAVTAASRVTGLVTPGPRWTRFVVPAASISCPHTSGARFWLSGKRTVWKPSSSAIRAESAERRGTGPSSTPTSMGGGEHPAGARCQPALLERRADVLTVHTMDKILRVDMGKLTVTEQPFPEEWTLVGGRGLSAKILLKEVDPKCDPLGEGNKLVLAPGVL